MQIGSKNFDFENKCYIMGILNFTPDSFSDGGKFNTLDKALFHVEEMLNDGMDILDIGGESTRPGHIQISVEEEISRIAPVIKAVKERFDVPVSLDTYKYQVAQAGIQEGADLINDIWGLKYDNGEMAKLIAKHKLPCCLMHNKAKAEYENFVEDMVNETAQCAKIALENGIDKDKIILDPGVGFGKTFENNLDAINNLDKLCELGYPVLLGTSRKSVIANALDLPADQRVEGTVATSVMGVMKGAKIFRVHDVLENARAIKMTEIILNGHK